MRALNIDVARCDKCSARLELRALVMTTAGIPRRGLPRVVTRYLAWLGEPTEPPRLATSRAPPSADDLASR
jgi:hypothetical protein